ncbi:MAG TPA: DUF1800 domain-containing protein, partial [Acidisarcina sp.]
WIDQQLNPEKIDDRALLARLSAYPAMQLSTPELERRYPSQLMIRALAGGKGAGQGTAQAAGQRQVGQFGQGGFGQRRFGRMQRRNQGSFERADAIEIPNDPIEHAIYANQIAYYKERKAKEAGKQETATATTQGDTQAAGTETQADMQADKDDAMMASKPGADAAKPGAKADVYTDPLMDNSKDTADDEARGRYSEAAISQILSLPPDQRINAFVGLPAGDFRSFIKRLSPQQKLQAIEGLSPNQKEILIALVSPAALVGGEVLQTRMLTDVYSERQLQAVMTDFWLNHFNVYMKKGPFAPWYLADYQNNVVAPRAMGKFEDLLVATAKSPAMLFYLDNHTSIGPHSQAVSNAQRYLTGDKAQKAKSLGLNENYAREVMELHTLGVDGGYTQKDVTELAKVLTGWTIGDYRTGGQFEFNERRHEPGTKYVLGKEIKENGMNEGLEVLHMLATSPATAHLISQQLAVRFVSDNPSATLTNRMADTFLKSDGDIRQVLRTMFSSPEFWSKDAYRAKVKTPEEFVFSAVRASGGDTVQPQAIVQAIAQLGMPLYGMQTPNGYSWKSDAWVNSGDLLARINFAISLTSNRMGTVTDLDSLLKINDPAALPPVDKESQLEHVLLNFPLRPQTRATVLKQLDSGAVSLKATTVSDDSLQSGSSMNKNAVEAMEMDRRDGTEGGVKNAAFKGQKKDPGIGQGPRIPPPVDKDAAVLAALLLGSPDFQLR